MNRQFWWRSLILLLGILIVCLPADAAHGSQSGPSAGFSAGSSPGFPGDAAGNYNGRSGTSPQSVQAGQGTETGNYGANWYRQGTSASGMQAGTGPADPGISTVTGQHGDSSGHLDAGNNLETGSVRGGGSPQGTGSGNMAGTPGGRGVSHVPGILAGMAVIRGGMGSTHSVPGSSGSEIPTAGFGREQVPQRHQRGPPQQAGGYPCGPAQPANTLPQPSCQAGDGQKGENPLRPRSKRTVFLFREPDPDIPGMATSSMPSLLPFKMLLFGGYRRISKKNVLDHDTRNGIYQVITGRPGIEVKTLAGITGINENTLRYHLDILVSTGKVRCFVRHGAVRYFQNQGAYSPYDHIVFHYLWTDTPCRVMKLLYQHPGLGRQQLADTLAVSGPSITRQMEHLIEDGVVENRSTGRSNHYYLTDEAVLAIGRLLVHTRVLVQQEAMGQSVPVTAG